MVDGRSEERISIRLWRGYTSGLFFARHDGGDGADYTSTSFRTLRLPWESETALARRSHEALDALVEALLADGWRPEEPEPGAAWYELDFVRPLRRARPPRRASRTSESAHPADPRA